MTPMPTLTDRGDHQGGYRDMVPRASHFFRSNRMDPNESSNSTEYMRRYYAGHIIAGLSTKLPDTTTAEEAEKVARAVFILADAMVKEAFKRPAKR